MYTIITQTPQSTPTENPNIYEVIWEEIRTQLVEYSIKFPLVPVDQKENYAYLKPSQQYYRKNKRRIQTYVNNRRARVKHAEGSFTDLDLAEMQDKQNNLCYYCGEAKKLTVEHKTPLFRGGSNWPENLCLACKRCNSQKHIKTEEEYWQYRKERGL